MQYSFLSAAVLALISSVVAQTAGFDAITSPTQDQNIPAGSSFDIIWQPGTETGDITITLLQGATPSTLETGPVIAKSISNSLGKYTWTVPASSSFATYGFEITLDSAPTTLQYSFPFHITGGTSSSYSASGSATGASTTTIKLSTGPSYTATTPSSTVATSTSSVPSSTKTVVSTYSSSNSTSASATVAASSSSNVTLATTLTKVSSTTTGTKTSATVTGSSTSSSVTPVSTNAAATHIAGSIAMVGGIVLALAL